MQLSHYPKAIAIAQQSLLHQKQQSSKLKDTLSVFDREIEGAVAFDLELKNEQQRKFKKAELQTSEDYQDLMLQLRAAEVRIAELEIDLGLLLNSFSVAKLEIRQAIALAEAQAA